MQFYCTLKNPRSKRLKFKLLINILTIISFFFLWATGCSVAIPGAVMGLGNNHVYIKWCCSVRLVVLENQFTLCRAPQHTQCWVPSPWTPEQHSDPHCWQKWMIITNHSCYSDKSMAQTKSLKKNHLHLGSVLCESADLCKEFYSGSSEMWLRHQ
jgi:hypothetical protein